MPWGVHDNGMVQRVIFFKPFSKIQMNSNDANDHWELLSLGATPESETFSTHEQAMLKCGEPFKIMKNGTIFDVNHFTSSNALPWNTRFSSRWRRVFSTSTIL